MSPMSPKAMRAALGPLLGRHASTSTGPAAEKAEGKAEEKAEEKEKEEGTLSLTERGKLVMKKYGWVAVGVYSSVYATTLGTMTLLVHNGVDIAGLFEAVGLNRLIDLHTLNPNLGKETRGSGHGPAG